jgi:hypothetical protein
VRVRRVRGGGTDIDVKLSGVGGTFISFQETRGSNESYRATRAGQEGGESEPRGEREGQESRTFHLGNSSGNSSGIAIALSDHPFQQTDI